MSFFDASVVPMLEVFIYETTTLLDQLDEILLEAEKSKILSEDNINAIFRTMHTIKGSAAMMGLTSISTLAHHVEDMFFIIRDDSSKLNDSNREPIFDLLFQASDFLKSEIEAIQRGDEYQPADCTELTDLIAQEAAVMKGEAPPAAPAAAAASSATASSAPAASPKQAGGDVHQIRVFFDDDCQMENIRAFMLLTQLKDLCDYLDSDPPSPETNSACAQDIARDGFLVLFKSAHPIQEIYHVIENSMNIKSYEDIGVAVPKQQAPADISQASSTNSAPASPAGNSPANDAVHIPEPAAAQVSPINKSALGKQSLISVNQTKLDQLMDIMGEIVIAESMVASNPELKGLHLDDFYKSTRQLRKLTDQLQDVVMSIRMVPLASVFQKMNRIVRDMNKKLGKDVELVTVGGETEVDKTINDVLGDPFMHMIRNCMDHGIESPEERLAAGKPPQGTVTLAAQNVGGEIVISISDDGSGLNREKILQKAAQNGMLTKPENEYSDKEVFGLIMLPGFSTNDVVTEYSGRGVGMDVVRKNLESVSGNLSVDSKPGQGTTFTIKIPLTLAIVDGMVIAVNKDTFTIPITSIRQTFKLSDEVQLLTDTDGTEMIMQRGDCFPIIRLYSVYNIPTEVMNLEDGIFVLVESENKAACIFVDQLIGEQQVVVKPFPPFLNRYDIKNSGFAGCTIMGDGSISLILDVNNFLSKF